MAALLMFVLTGAALHAQQATVMMFYGGDWKEPIFLTDADAATFRNLLTATPISVKEMGDRPYRTVALFWGSRSDPATNGKRTLAELKPEMAWQHGRLYPPQNGKPAVLLVTALTKGGGQPVPVPSNGAAFVWGGPVSDAALAVLKARAIIPR
jgi:hypothetical protein